MELKNIIEQLRFHSSPSKAEAMMKYMKNKFEYMGIQKPKRHEISKLFINWAIQDPNVDLVKIIRDLWEAPERELQYFAIDLLMSAKKKWNVRTIELFEELITQKSWWDSVDIIAINGVGNYFKKWPEKEKEFAYQWNQSENRWLIRTSIIYMLKYKKEMDTKHLSAMIIPHLSSNEFFIQKAIGWVLREYSRTDKKWVENFVSTHSLKPLSKREALRLIKAGKVI